MTELLEKIKDRVNEKDSPIRTVKGVASAIGMSEAGFYVMLKRGTTKHGTLLAIAESLNVDPSYLSEGLNNKSDSKGLEVDKSPQSIKRFESALESLKNIFEEQLRNKDRELETKNKQIADLHRMLEAVLGKYEGVANQPLSTEAFDELMMTYRKSCFNQVSIPLTQKKKTVAKLVAPR